MTTLQSKQVNSKAQQEWMKERGARFAAARKLEVLTVLGVFGVLVAYGHWLLGLVVSTGLFVYRFRSFEKAYGVPPIPGTNAAADHPDNASDS